MSSRILQLEGTCDNVFVAGGEASVLNQLTEAGLRVITEVADDTTTVQVIDSAIVALVAPWYEKFEAQSRVE